MSIKKPQPPIIFHEIPSHDYNVGVVELNRPEALNAVSFSMYLSMIQELEKWESDEQIAVVVIHSNFEKAFCAGGDVKAVVTEARSKTNIDDQLEFFTNEYYFDYWLSQYKKPVVVWANGFTMGGGVGLLNSGHHRVVTETTLMSMPEVTIGFFPDVGAGHFLNRVPNDLGLFLGMTGCRIDGWDSVHLGLSDYCILSDKKEIMLGEFGLWQWTGDKDTDNVKLTEFFKNLQGPLKESDLLSAWERNGPFPLDHFETMDDFVLNHDFKHFAFKLAQRSAMEGSALSRRVFYEHFKACKTLDRREIFLREWHLAREFLRESDFQEGVRALLVDKDKSPQWKFNEASQWTADFLDRFFEGHDTGNLLAEKLDQNDHLRA